MLSSVVEKTWREERLMSLHDILQESHNQPLLIKISDILKNGLANPRDLSAEQDKFQSNISLFVEGLTGKKGLEFQEALLTLRDMSVNKNEQAKVLYEAIQKQQTQIHLQQQIISCLEYRHVLEELPNRKSKMETPPRPTHGHAEAWKKTWRLAIECKLDKMIKIHISPLPAESTLVTSPDSKRSLEKHVVSGEPEQASTTQTTPTPKSASSNSSAPTNEATLSINTSPTALSAARSSLRQFLQYDFNNWAKGSTQLKKARNTRKIPGREKRKQASSEPTNPKLGTFPEIADFVFESLYGPVEPGAGISSTEATENTEEPDTTDTINPRDPIDAQATQDAIITSTREAGSINSTNASSNAQTRDDTHTVSKSKHAKTSQYKSTGNFQTVNGFKPDYEVWPSFQRGDSMYHDLSRNIHQYGKSYEVHEINFSNSDMSIFAWLKPDPKDFDPDTKEVDWIAVWEKRGLT